MSLIRQEDSKKWINSSVAVFSVVIGIILFRFFSALGEWFGLEAKIPYFVLIAQILTVGLSLGVFLLVTSYPKSSKYLNEVFVELTKIVWPDSDSVLKSTIGIVIGVAIVSGIFVSVDYSCRWLLGQIY